MNKKICVMSLILIVSIVILAIFINKNTTEKNESNPTDTLCSANDGYCIYNYDGDEYLVLNNGYNGEYDIAYFDVNTKDIESIKDFSIFTYEEYNNFCEKYNINKKYNDDGSNYIIYFYSIENSNSINAKLGDVEYKNDKVTLYIWDKVNYNGGMFAADGAKKAYVIIIPTNNSVNDYEIKPLIHKTEYNKIAKLNPLDGYSFNKEDNEKLAFQDHINSSNSNLNTIINNSLDALAKKHTIKVDTYIDGSDTHLISYMDLINSVFKIQGGTEALHYIGYATDMRLLYVNYGEDYYSYDYTYIDRNIMLLDIFSEFGNNFLQNIDNYETVIIEDSKDYIIEANLNEYKKATYYIDKETYLIDKIMTDNRTNNFSYTNDNVLMPDDIYNNEYPITVDKPILYLYPEKETELSVYLENSDSLIVSYPTYNNSWDVVAYPNGNIYDKKTKRNYYGLYWESKLNKIVSMDTGFVVKNENLIEFLEEKLTILGLNEKEMNEFIIYWLPVLTKNEYNLIHFLTDEEVENMVPISFSINPDTMIRVYMQVKPLNEFIEIDEQQLYSKERSGFTTVDWGGIILN